MCLLYVNEQDILFFYGSSDPHCLSWFGMCRKAGLLQKVLDRQTIVLQWTFPHFTKKTNFHENFCLRSHLTSSCLIFLARSNDKISYLMEEIWRQISPDNKSLLHSSHCQATCTQNVTSPNCLKLLISVYKNFF